MTIRILGICGSLQQRSANLSLLQYAVSNAPAGVEVKLYHGLRGLPWFNPDLERGTPPTQVIELRLAIAHSDALLIASPEYGHSLPGALKNAIDWLIGSGELENKLIAITSAVPAAERGRLGLKALRDTLAAVSARVPFQEPIVKGQDFEDRVSALVALLAQVSSRES